MRVGTQPHHGRDRLWLRLRSTDATIAGVRKRVAADKRQQFRGTFGKLRVMQHRVRVMIRWMKYQFITKGTSRNDEYAASTRKGIAVLETGASSTIPTTMMITGESLVFSRRMLAGTILSYRSYRYCAMYKSFIYRYAKAGDW